MALVYNETTGVFEEVRDLPQILEFKTTTSSLFEGQAFMLQWRVGNASIIEIDGERMPPGVNQLEVMCDFDSSKRFTLTARNGSEVVNKHLLVKALPRPKFNLTSSNPRIRRNTRESSLISWNIENAVSATIVIDDKVEEIPLSGKRDFKPSERQVIRFSALGLDHRAIFTEESVIEVFDASKVKFSCDKKYSFPKLPVVLSWQTTNCAEVELVGFGIHSTKGRMVVEPEETTEYILRVTDHFDTHDYVVRVAMLPLPVIKSIMVDVPKLEHIIPISYNTPQFVYVPEIPMIETIFSKIEMPRIPELKDSGYMVGAKETPRERLSQRFAKMFNHIFK